MILSTVPGMVTLGCSGIRVASRFSSAIRADLAMRGLAISFVMLARVALISRFVALFMHHHRIEIEAVQFPFTHLRNTRLIVGSITSGSARTFAGETMAASEDFSSACSRAWLNRALPSGAASPADAEILQGFRDGVKTGTGQAA